MFERETENSVGIVELVSHLLSFLSLAHIYLVFNQCLIVGLEYKFKYRKKGQ